MKTNKMDFCLGYIPFFLLNISSFLFMKKVLRLLGSLKTALKVSEIAFNSICKGDLNSPANRKIRDNFEVNRNDFALELSKLQRLLVFLLSYDLNLKVKNILEIRAFEENLVIFYSDFDNVMHWVEYKFVYLPKRDLTILEKLNS